MTACDRFEPSWARVISGVDEGIYGWIALNYLTGHLEANADGQLDSGKYCHCQSRHDAMHMWVAIVVEL